jgi:hypothetical protein
MKPHSWKDFAPWFLTITCTLTLIVIGLFLETNINWYKNTVFNNSISEANTPEFRFYAYHLHLSMIKRSIGLFSGFAIMFLGMGVAFYTLKDTTTIDGQTKVLSMKLATASPGIVALIVGAYLIVSTINSKDYFPPYNSSELSQIQKPLDTSLKPEIPK